MKNINLQDYWKMTKSRGLRLPIKYFVENHLFDIIHKTDTHRWLPKNNYDQSIENLDRGVLYMASWTSIINLSTKIAVEYLVKDNAEFDMVDIGSGKGKTLLVWANSCNIPKNTSIFGIEYNKELIRISLDNLSKTSLLNKPDIINGDATNLDISLFKDKILFYLYNPFDAVILRNFLKNIISKKVILIYNNPEHSSVLDDFGYTNIYTKDGWHPNACFNIYKSANY
jgi:hypothetical protein